MTTNFGPVVRESESDIYFQASRTHLARESIQLCALTHRATKVSQQVRGSVAWDQLWPTTDAHSLLTSCAFPAVLPCL